jgi:multidrug resistance efflux pump
MPFPPHDLRKRQPASLDTRFPKASTMRRLKMILAVVTALTAVWIGWSYLPKNAPSARQSSALAAPSSDSSGINQIYAGGIVEGAQRETSLQFEIAGRIERINVHEGDLIEAGCVLAQLEAGFCELKLAEAGTQLKMARAERERLTNNSKLPARREDLVIADSKVALAEGAVRRERLMLEKTELRAPTNGIVLRVRGEPGELAGPGADQELIAIVNRDVTRVRAWVEELDALNVAPGQRAAVSADGIPGRRFEATVRSCAPGVGPKSQRHMKPGEMFDVRVREILIELADGADLLIGLPVDVLISLDQPRPDRSESPHRAGNHLSAAPNATTDR